VSSATASPEIGSGASRFATSGVETEVDLSLRREEIPVAEEAGRGGEAFCCVGLTAVRSHGVCARNVTTVTHQWQETRIAIHYRVELAARHASSAVNAVCKHRPSRPTSTQRDTQTDRERRVRVTDCCCWPARQCSRYFFTTAVLSYAVDCSHHGV